MLRINQKFLYSNTYSVRKNEFVMNIIHIVQYTKIEHLMHRVKYLQHDTKKRKEKDIKIMPSDNEHVLKVPTNNARALKFCNIFINRVEIFKKLLFCSFLKFS